MDTISLFRFSSLSFEKQILVIVFIISITIRILPELAAYPYPIGYDVVNYYIPKVENLMQEWSTVSTQFPLYIILLYSVKMTTGLAPAIVVASVAAVVAGLFAVALYCLGRNLLRLDIKQSFFLALFCIFQMAVLRTFWDLHRDVLALTAMIFLLSFLAKEGDKKGWKMLFITLPLTAITVTADRMIGALLCVSLASSLIFLKERRGLALPTFLALCLFSALILASYQASNQGTGNLLTGASGNNTPAFYNQENLVILFLVVNSLLFIPAAIGFLRLQNSSSMLLKIPMLVTLVGSFAWIAFPENSLLAADRWIILNGIFLSIFAGCGFLRLLNALKPKLSAILACSTLAAFGFIGIGYALMPYDSPFPLYGAVRSYTSHFSPVTMQFNSLDTEDNENLLKTITMLNKNTEHNAIIVGEPHWRGFMELYLKDGRTYQYSDDPVALSLTLAERGYLHIYLIEPAEDHQITKFNIQSIQ